MMEDDELQEARERIALLSKNITYTPMIDHRFVNIYNEKVNNDMEERLTQLGFREDENAGFRTYTKAIGGNDVVLDMLRADCKMKWSCSLEANDTFDSTARVYLNNDCTIEWVEDMVKLLQGAEWRGK